MLFIYAYEQMYQGMHGMYDRCFIEGTDIYDDVAIDEAIDMSLGVIESYSQIINLIEDEAAECTDYDLQDKEYDQNQWDRLYDLYLEELMNDDIFYQIFKVKDEYSKGKTDTMLDQETLNLSPEEIIEEYCECKM